jgi:zinc transporter ZupT
MDNNVVFAFLLTLFAGLSTGFGSLLALLPKKQTLNFYLSAWVFRPE